MKVFHDKTSEEVEEQDNEAIRIGHDLEDYVAQRFMEATGLKVRKSNFMYRSKEHPFMIADVDRLVVGEDAGLEYVTPQGVIGYVPVAIKSLYGQEFGRYENRQDVGRIQEFLNMENLTPKSSVATIICLYIVSSFNYSLFKKAKIPIKFLLFLHGKRTTRKTSLVSAIYY